MCVSVRVSEVHHSGDMAMNGYLLGALCGAGITGNLLTVVVLQRDNDKKNPANWLLQAHAIFDSLYLLTRLLARQFQFLACREMDWMPVTVNRHMALSLIHI